MRIALGVEYEGTAFHGWQAQKNIPTVQGTLESALSQIANEPIATYCAGRTDAGVHGAGQVVHFDTVANRDSRAWTLGVNTLLPASISIKWVQNVPAEFHARFSALSRRYRYLIHNHPLRSALLASRATWYYRPLDCEVMQFAGNYLLGEHDFSSFRSAQCESKTPNRNVQQLKVMRQENLVIIEITANAFLHHMVRNIVGVLLQIGSGYQKPNWMLEVLQAKNRCAAAETSPPQGLYLTEVSYPKEYEIPE